jgi:hypothetical protein
VAAEIHMVKFWLNAGAAVSALCAAVCWFASAAVKTPEIDYGWPGLTNNPEKIVSMIKSSARWNRVAALFAGISALLIAASIVCVISN